MPTYNLTFSISPTMTLSLTSGQRRGVIAALVVCVLINAALYLTVSYSKTPATHGLHDTRHLHGYRGLLKQDHLDRCARPVNIPRWVKEISADLRLQSSSSRGNLTLYPTGGVILPTNTTASATILGERVEDHSEIAITTMAGKGTDEFDVLRVLYLFESCKQENDDVLIDCYNDAYEELCKFFQLFGTIFSFVTSDVVEKIGILREYRKGENGEKYRTIQNMVKYEVENSLTIQKHKPSGCRTLLRLHRALEFISALLAKIRDGENKSKFSHEATLAYDATLAKFHPWLVRKAVHVAMYTLPTRQQLLAKLKVDDTPESVEKINKLITQLDDVYNITQHHYASNNLLDLP